MPRLSSSNGQSSSCNLHSFTIRQPTISTIGCFGFDVTCGVCEPPKGYASASPAAEAHTHVEGAAACSPFERKAPKGACTPQVDRSLARDAYEMKGAILAEKANKIGLQLQICSNELQQADYDVFNFSENDAIDQRLDPEMELDRLNRKAVDLRLEQKRLKELHMQCMSAFRDNHESTSRSLKKPFAVPDAEEVLFLCLTPLGVGKT